MSPELLDPESPSPRRIALGWGLAGVVVLQFMAFWHVCSHQVRMAEVRSTEAQMAQTALSDCLQYIPGATIGSCTARVGLASAKSDAPADSLMQADHQPSAAPAPQAAVHATPVGYSYR